MKNLFKKKTPKIKARFGMVPDAEDPKTAYCEMPDNLRLIFREGKYVGWYTPELVEVLN